MRALPAYLRRHPATALAALLLAGLLAAAVFAAPLVGDDPQEMVATPFLWPGADGAFPLGSDMLGRDLLAGLIYGARMSLAVGLASAVIAIGLGVSVGTASGYCGGWVDDALMRLTELFQTMPSLLFAIVLVTILQPSVGSIIIGIGLTSWPQVARLVRAEVLRLRGAEFVQAAIVAGMGHLRIVSRHILPNALSPVVVTTSILVANAILTEAVLAFLGLGDPNLVSWGSMIGSGREVLRTAWYMTALPGAAIFVTVIAISQVGNSLNDHLNPRGRR